MLITEISILAKKYIWTSQNKPNNPDSVFQKLKYLENEQKRGLKFPNCDFSTKSDLSNFIYFKNNLSGSNLRNNPNRRSGGGSHNGGSGGLYYGGSGGSYNGGSYNGYKRRKVEPEDTGYGIVSAASEAYKVISKYIDVP